MRYRFLEDLNACIFVCPLTIKLSGAETGIFRENYRLINITDVDDLALCIDTPGPIFCLLFGVSSGCA